MSCAKRILTKVFCMAVLVLFLFSCHSNNSVISSWGKRKYMKGYYWNMHGSVKDNKGNRHDSIQRNKKEVIAPPEKKTVEPPMPNQPVVAKIVPTHKHRHRNRDSIRRSNAMQRASVTKSAGKKVNPPGPSDKYSMRLLILITVLAGFSLFVTGLITPIVIWGITQNFLLVAGVFITFFGFSISIDKKLGINLSGDKMTDQSNIGKPAFALSCWGVLLMAFLMSIVKTSQVANLPEVELATLGMFFAGICIFLSMILAIKALFAHDRHQGKAILAIVIDVILIATSLLVLF